MLQQMNMNQPSTVTHDANLILHDKDQTAQYKHNTFISEGDLSHSSMSLEGRGFSDNMFDQYCYCIDYFNCWLFQLVCVCCRNK